VIKRILVVEDEPVSRHFLATLLELAGYQVTTAIDGLDALDKIDAYGPDLVISDIAMPHCDGIDLLRTLRRTIEHRSLPVIMLTAYGSENLFNAINAGANAALRKPVETESLMPLVASLLDEPEREISVQRA
jgi:two-component system chemotaxis sensor kinase CheA